MSTPMIREVKSRSKRIIFEIRHFNMWSSLHIMDSYYDLDSRLASVFGQGHNYKFLVGFAPQMGYRKVRPGLYLSNFNKGV